MKSDFRFLYLFPIVIFLLQLVVIDIRLVVIMWRQRNMGVPTRNTLLALYILFCNSYLMQTSLSSCTLPQCSCFLSLSDYYSYSLFLSYLK